MAALLCSAICLAEPAPLHQKWSRGFSSPQWKRRETSVPALIGDRVYVGTSAGRFYALDAATGKKRWAYKAGAPIRSRAGGDDTVVIFGDSKGQLHGLDADSGRSLWNVQFEGEILGQPAFTRERAVIETMDGKLHALDAKSGKIAWSIAAPPHSQLALFIGSGPLISGEVVFAVFPTGYVIAVDLADGRRLWDKLLDLSDRPFSGATDPALVGDQLVVTLVNQGVVSLDRKTGSVTWRFDEPEALVAVSDGSRLALGTVSGKIYALQSSDGKILWKNETLVGKLGKNDFLGGLSVYQGRWILAATSDHYLWSLDASNGAVAGSTSKWGWWGPGFLGPPVVGSSSWLAWSARGRLYAFE